MQRGLQVKNESRDTGRPAQQEEAGWRSAHPGGVGFRPRALLRQTLHHGPGAVPEEDGSPEVRLDSHEGVGMPLPWPQNAQGVSVSRLPPPPTPGLVHAPQELG